MSNETPKGWDNVEPGFETQSFPIGYTWAMRIEGPDNNGLFAAVVVAPDGTEYVIEIQTLPAFVAD